jgi:hypothetical protein
MRTSHILVLAFVSFLICGSALSAGDIYFWTDQKGVLHISYEPPSATNRTYEKNAHPSELSNSTSSPASGSETGFYDYPDKGFSIKLPDNWVEIPDSILAIALAQNPIMEEKHKGKLTCGYQLKSAARWFEYPYILISIENMGKMPEQELLAYEQIYSEAVKKEIDKGVKKSDFINSFDVGKMYYDPELKILWWKTQAHVVEYGPIFSLSGMIPTEKGVIQIICYCRQPESQVYSPVFESTIKSVIVSEALEYKSEGDRQDLGWLYGKWGLAYDSSNDPKDYMVFKPGSRYEHVFPDGRIAKGNFSVLGDNINLNLFYKNKNIKLPLTISRDKTKLSNDKGAYYEKEE